MKQSKKTAFTLIELIATLVIMAILALIVTPLVLNIIRKARTAADKRSIDAYGRSIEIAIAGYLLDSGTFPTSIGQLTIEYSGDEVVCSTTQLNGDSSVYLTGCTVNGRETDYEYGIDNSPSYTVYSIGDTVTYNDVDYYVIKDSGTDESTVTLLKSKPLTMEEIVDYKPAEAQFRNSGIQYHASSNAYDTSYIKIIVDAWKNDKAQDAIEARLISLNEIVALGYEWKQTCDTCGMGWAKTDATPTWLYSSSYYWYWTGSLYNDSVSDVWVMNSDGSLRTQPVDGHHGSSVGDVRPVIVLPKSAI